MKTAYRILVLVVLGMIGLMALVGCMQRRLLYFPTHEHSPAVGREAVFARWEIDGEYTGVAHVVPEPRRIWFFIHGNGGQAAHRGYVLPRIAPNDSLYVLEYPGYGERPGKPSRETFDAAALKAYQWLVRTHGVGRLVVLGESLGSGPASRLARAPTPPKHIVLVVPFDVLIDVAREKYAFLPVRLLMLDRWNNIAALKGYSGRLDVFGATNDEVIPVQHARKLAAAVPGAVFHEISGGHGWAENPEVNLGALE